MRWWQERLLKNGIGSRFVLAFLLTAALILCVVYAVLVFPESELAKVLVGALIGLASAAVNHYFTGRANGSTTPKEG